MPGARCHAALLTAVLLLSTAGGQAHLEGQSALPVELNATTLVTALAHQSAVVLFHTRWRVAHSRCPQRTARKQVLAPPHSPTRARRLPTQVCPVHRLRARVPPRGGRVREAHERQRGSALWQVRSLCPLLNAAGTHDLPPATSHVLLPAPPASQRGCGRSQGGRGLLRRALCPLRHPPRPRRLVSARRQRRAGRPAGGAVRRPPGGGAHRGVGEQQVRSF